MNQGANIIENRTSNIAWPCLLVCSKEFDQTKRRSAFSISPHSGMAKSSKPEAQYDLSLPGVCGKPLHKSTRQLTLSVPRTPIARESDLLTRSRYYREVWMAETVEWCYLLYLPGVQGPSGVWEGGRVSLERFTSSSHILLLDCIGASSRNCIEDSRYHHIRHIYHHTDTSI